MLLFLFSRSVVSNSLQPHGLQHTRLPCPSPSPGICSNSCPLSQWCHSNHLILCHPLLLPSIFPSIRAFSNESALCIRWPKYWSFSFSISPSNEYSGLISFWINWLDLLAVQGTLKSLLQHHSSEASVLQGSAFFFFVQLSHLYMTTGKTIVLTRWTFAGKSIWCLCFLVRCLGFHSFPSKEQASFNFMASVTICNDFGAPKDKVCYSFHFFPICFPWTDGTGCHDLCYLNVELWANFFTFLFHFHQEAL